MKRLLPKSLIAGVTLVVTLASALPLLALPYSGAGPYSPSGDVAGSASISVTDPRIVEWASTVINYSPGYVDIANPSEGMPTAPFITTSKALGTADCTPSDPYEVVSLGNAGSITVGFAKPIVAGNGPDFAVFTNKFKIADGVPNDYFLELAYVAVSSDGVNFFTFPSVSVTPTATQVGGFSALDPTNIYDLAGKDIAGYGTPFSLKELAGVSPLLDLNHIVAVRITDVIGNIDPNHAAVSRDSKGNIINAPYPTPYASSGFSLDAVAVLNVTPPVSDTPTMPTAALVVLALLILYFARQKLALAPVSGGRPGCSRGFTLTELLVVMCIISVLSVLSYTALINAIRKAQAAASMSNLRQLAIANLAYAADHDGYFCPAQDEYNLVRWHGVRDSVSDPFDSSKGYLAPYLDGDGKIKVCPLFAQFVSGFEDGSGGYGYNETYIGGTPANLYQPNRITQVPNPTQTVMFTTTAFAKSNGMQEYPFSEPPQWVAPNGSLSGSLQPSTHFRADGKALVAWCDGHVSAEPPSQLGGTDYYGGNSGQDLIGWFGPLANNGYWNPNYGR